MVKGLDIFKERFKDHTECYTVIGGTACAIVSEEADLPFRATSDIDMILICKETFHEFAEIFWAFIKEGNYTCGWKENGDVHFYRFTNPITGYPKQIELFARKPDYVFNPPPTIIPVHIGDDVQSLSAIVLNDDFYNFMIEGRIIVKEIPVLKAEYLIPFKMYAWINLLQKKNEGEFVKEGDVNKHKYDVFRLLRMVTTETKVSSSGEVRKSIEEFMEGISKLPTNEINLKQIGLPFDRDRGVELLKEIYLL